VVFGLSDTSHSGATWRLSCFIRTEGGAAFQKALDLQKSAENFARLPGVMAEEVKLAGET
jgi:hypothetical protein